MSLINKIDKCHCSNNIHCIQCNGTWIYVNDRGLRICQECEKVFTWKDQPELQELLKWSKEREKNEKQIHNNR